MTTAETQLLALIRERAFKRGTFKLASGDTSTYYIDGKMFEVYGPAAHLVGVVLHERTRKLGIDAIGGLEVGAVPLVTATVIAYHQAGQVLEGFWCRDKTKAHGTRKLVEGNVRPGMRVVVVDDVITRGNSTIKAIEAVREAGAEVVAVVALVDRLQGAADLFRQHGITSYTPVFTIRDLGVEEEDTSAQRGQPAVTAQ
jgi:orotate phosphoribosyltransferase